MANKKCVPCGLKSPKYFKVSYPNNDGFTGSGCVDFNKVKVVCLVSGANYCSYTQCEVLDQNYNTVSSWVSGIKSEFSGVFQGMRMYFAHTDYECYVKYPTCVPMYFCQPNIGYGTFGASMDCTKPLLFNFDKYRVIPSFQEPPPECDPYCASVPSQILLTPVKLDCGCCQAVPIDQLPKTVNIIITENIYCPSKLPVGTVIPLTYTDDCPLGGVEYWFDSYRGKCWLGSHGIYHFGFGCYWFQELHPPFDWFQSWIITGSCASDVNQGIVMGSVTMHGYPEGCNPLYAEGGFSMPYSGLSCDCLTDFYLGIKCVVTEP